jgi:hypothetical protein
MWAMHVVQEQTMSDRCYIRVWCARCDVNLFEPIGLLEDGGDEAVAELVNAECNYAAGMGSGDEEVNGWPLRVPFFGWHSGGGEYGALQFVCLGDRRVITVADYKDQVVVAFNGATGQPVFSDVENACAFFAAMAVVRNHLMMRQTEVPGGASRA